MTSNARPLLSFLCVLLCATTLTGARVARAQDAGEEPTADDATAAHFFAVARDAFNQGQFGSALRAFEESYNLSHRPELLYNIGLTLDRLERTAEAADRYEQYLAETPDAENANAVRARVEIIRAHLAQEAPAAPAGDDPAVASTGGDEPEGAASGGGGGDVAIDVAVAMFVVGGVGLLTFAGAGAAAFATHDDLSGRCAPGCDPQDADTVRALSITADVGLGVGLAFAAAGVVFLIVGSGSSDGGDDTAAAPWVTPTAAGVAVRQRF